ncbi:hypothetical protein PR003_g18804 [Phytophthora rubi]|uniref:Uncharacterized protein n=1 Tax=Phytophthora rubi TaxID=129364 RepID=A0A6A3PC44_9STRA|nr:hypothetical protein PR001_g2783 [Phytophthora rubi]KAE9316131.1 hypothetical protein PR003_g18804 [Phytophthora rubi]
MHRQGHQAQREHERQEHHTVNAERCDCGHRAVRRKTNFERLQKFYKFFFANDEARRAPSTRTCRSKWRGRRSRTGSRRPRSSSADNIPYNAIRMQLKHAGGDAILEASKDRPVLQANKAHLQKMKHITKTLGFLESHIIKNKGPYGTGPTPTLILQSTACCSASTRVHPESQPPSQTRTRTCSVSSRR